METPILSQGEDVSNDGINNNIQSVRRRVVNWRRAGPKITLRRLIYLLIPMLLLAILAILLGVLLSRNHHHHDDSDTDTSGDIDVDLGYAQYRGTARSNGISQWLGMRYAAPPLGNLRFRAPQDPLNTTGVQDATKNTPICLATSEKTLTSSKSEDCLFVNVFTPTQNFTAGKLLPVYIFIQGGGFNQLSNPYYDGSSLIAASGNEIVIVTFNYRVGPYGFLTSKEIQVNGDLNIGLKDQRKVFQWVQKYISKFGGDPSQVTIGGDSAGAASVDLHLTAYGGRNDGLFHAAAAESQSFSPNLNVEESQYQYDALVSRTGCSSEVDTLSCLRNLDISVLQKNNIQIPYPNQTGSPLYMYSTVIDGDMVPDSTYRLFAQGKFIKVPVIFGDVTNEGTIFTPKNIASYTHMNTFLQNNFPNLTASQLSKIDSLYPKAQQFPGTGAFWRTASDAYGEMRYNCPGIFISSAFDNASVVGNWNYHYNVTDPKADTQGYGVSHAVEIHAIWGGPPFVPSGTPSSYTTSPNKDIIPIIQGYWTSFIRAHDPNTYRFPGSPVWERFSVKGNERILFETLGNGSRMESVDEGQLERCAYLSGIGTALQQ